MSRRPPGITDRRRVPSLVPTPKTRELVEQMIMADLSAYDAALRFLPKLESGQVPALVGLLIGNARRPRNLNLGRRAMPFRFTVEERRAGKAAWKRGVRSKLVEDQRREYDRWAAIEYRRRRGQLERDLGATG